MSDRDIRKPLPTPPSIRAQTARPVDEEPESWEDQSGEGKASTGVLAKPLDVPESPTEILIRRSGETKNTALDLAVKVENLEIRLDGTDAKIDGIFPVLGDLRLAIAKQDDTLARQDQILEKQSELATDTLRVLLRERDRSGEIKLTTTLSELKVEETEHLSNLELLKARELSQLKQTEADRDARREVLKAGALKVIAGVALAAGFVATFLAGRC
jgi:hypothetical protein